MKKLAAAWYINNRGVKASQLTETPLIPISSSSLGGRLHAPFYLVLYWENDPEIRPTDFIKAFILVGPLAQHF